MRASKFAKVAVTCGVLLLCAFLFAGCTEQDETEISKTKIEGLTGGIAATVNGIEIEEDAVTTYIHNYRKTYGLTTDVAWAEWLLENEYTPQTLRESTINTYISQELIKKAAEEYEIEIPSLEIDAYIESISVSYGDEEAWQQALEKEGISEEEYRETIEVALLKRSIKDTVDPGEDPSDEEIFEYALNHIHSYEGAKKSEHILLAASDNKLAEEVLRKIKNSEISFEDAAAEYSIDSENAQEGGNKGWNVLDTNMATAYSTALNDLQKGEVSELVTSEYGIHIIKCVDVYTEVEPLIELSQVPQDFIEDIRATLASNNKNDAYTNWYEAYYDAADIVINEMPEKVPYNIDLSKYMDTEKEEAADPRVPDTLETLETDPSDELNPSTENDPNAILEEGLPDAIMEQPAEIE